MQFKHKTTGAIITVPENGSYEHLTSFEAVKPVSKPTESGAPKSTRTKSTGKSTAAKPKTRARKKAEVGDGEGN